jgi:predicted lactoylglutathione lyase
MEQRLNLVTLGVQDLDRAQAFYEALGWAGRRPDEEVVFFQAGGMVFALYRRDKLLAENGLGPAEGASTVTLGYLVRSPEEADALLAEAEAAGGTITRPAERMFWGGYSGTFADPDGHAWEVAHNEGWELAEDGTVRLDR